MYPILIISIIALTIILMKWWTLRTKSIIPEVFTGDLYSLISQGRLEEATGLSMREDSSIARIALAALSGNHKGREELREDIEEAGRRESHELSRYLEGLGAISNVSTLLGLLGTISGMIKIFDVIATEIIVNQQNLAGGISEALYTTAFGLSVAIPVFLAYKFFSGKVDDYISELELEGRKIMEDVLATRDLTPLSTDEAPSGITL
ncbi:MAG: MotA/TolQ/ExbB proton channel family protein [Thermodesulfobacteriota bacterium]